MGSTYERGRHDVAVSAVAHDSNAASLNAMCPPAARQLREAMADGTLLGWAQVRCASLDRLPLVGAAPDCEALRSLMEPPRRMRMPLAATPRLAGLHLLTALGSRGITLAHWCATRLAASLDGEPARQDEADLLAAIDPARFAWKHARRRPPAAARA